MKETGQTINARMTNVESQNEKIHNYVIGIAVVSAFSVITLLVAVFSVWRESNEFKDSTYQVLVDKVNTLVEQNQEQQQSANDQQMQALQAQITELKKNNPYLK